MANDDWLQSRGGMLPIEYPYGNFRKNIYKLTTSTAAVFLGMPCDADANGNVTLAIAGANTGTTLTYLLGSIVGFLDPNQFGLPNAMFSLTVGPYLPGSTDANVVVADDPDQLFTMQVGTNGTVITTANLMDYCGFSYLRGSSGNTITGFAGCEIDNLTYTTTGSGSLQVVGLYPLKNSDATTNAVGNYAKVKVRITAPRIGARYGSISAV